MSIFSFEDVIPNFVSERVLLYDAKDVYNSIITTLACSYEEREVTSKKIIYIKVY